MVYLPHEVVAIVPLWMMSSQIQTLSCKVLLCNDVCKHVCIKSGDYRVCNIHRRMTSSLRGL